jgi:hypothetical protein
LGVAGHSRKCGAHLQAVGHTGSSLYDANGAHWQTAGHMKCMDTLAGTDHTRHTGHTCGERSHEAHGTDRQQINRHAEPRCKLDTMYIILGPKSKL